HQGEVSFPGGAIEAGETPAEGALREAAEEIGLDPASVEIVGELDHLTTVSSRSFIVPLVGLLPGRPDSLVPNAGEVDAVLHVPVAELLLDDVYRAEAWPWFDGGSRDIHFFELVGDTIWGATASMLRQLLGWCLGLDVRVDHP
ncbi:MAG: CoA pyrophosphatase, partial [Chloroflexi bacterium]|nr:CoA pyrophosphatase [Chloroflexota bacterium]